MSNTNTVPVMTRSEIKAAREALKAATAESRKAETKKATTVAKNLLRNLPEHEFGTGSIGRSIRQSVTIDGRQAFLNVTLVWSDTVVKVDAEASA